jgi:hypothetical protein
MKTNQFVQQLGEKYTGDAISLLVLRYEFKSEIILIIDELNELSE